MIYLFTGLPGAGKTLRTIFEVNQLSTKDSRAVFYHGIKDLTLPWNLLESPQDWNTCPQGSIIVIDECQSTFRPRANGSQVPEYVQAFETHRHKGYDIFLITQHPMLLDGNVRRLIGKHKHLVRAFGFNKAYIHEFQQVRDNVDKNKKDSLRQSWSYPKEVFNYYKSAEIHTVKSALPKRIYFLFLIPFLLALIFYYGYKSLNKLSHPTETTPVNQTLLEGDNFSSGRIIKASYLESMKPEIQDLPYTADRYREITKPVVAPIPAACIASKSRCHCYSQQATKMDVDDTLCRQIAANGIFIDWQQQKDGFKPQRVAEKETQNDKPDYSGRPVPADIPKFTNN